MRAPLLQPWDRLMRVRFASATGCPFGQFIIEAESKEDEALLACFLSAPHEEWTFWRHGSTYGHYSPASFNFGWVRTDWLTKGRRERRWYVRAWRRMKSIARLRIEVRVTHPTGGPNDA
jgi:hypothetical protein